MLHEPQGASGESDSHYRRSVAVKRRPAVAAPPLPQAREPRPPCPSRYEAWNDGERTKDISIERVIGGPAFRSSQDDDLLQMADLIAHALLKQEEEPSPRVEAPGHRPGLQHPRPRPQPQCVEARPPGHRQEVRDWGSGPALGRENVPRKVLTEIAPPPAVHSVMDHVSPVLMFPDPSRHLDPSAH